MTVFNYAEGGYIYKYIFLNNSTKSVFCENYSSATNQYTSYVLYVEKQGSTVMKRKVCLSDPLNPPNEPDKYLYLCLNLNKQVCRASNGNRPTGEYYWKTDTVPVLQTYSGSVVWFKKNQNGFLYDPDTDMNEHDGFIKEVTDIQNGISMATEWYLVHPTYTDYLDANYKIGNRYAIIGEDDYDITTAPSIQLLN